MAKFDFSKEEKFVIEWFEKNGFDGALNKQYVSKTIFTVKKNDVTDKFELPQGIAFKSISDYMEQYARNFEMLCKLKKIEKGNDV